MGVANTEDVSSCLNIHPQKWVECIHWFQSLGMWCCIILYGYWHFGGSFYPEDWDAVFLVETLATLHHIMEFRQSISCYLTLEHWASTKLLISPLSISFSCIILHFLLGLLHLHCPWQFQLRACFSVAQESFLGVCSVRCSLCSLIYTATCFSCAHLHSSLWEVTWSQNILKIFLRHLSHPWKLELIHCYILILSFFCISPYTVGSMTWYLSLCQTNVCYA